MQKEISSSMRAAIVDDDVKDRELLYNFIQRYRSETGADIRADFFPGSLEFLETFHADYDIIFLGFPNWNADLPMPLYTFLEEYDFGGKTIIPFTVHGGSGFSRTIQTIAGLQLDADVITDGLAISRNNVSDAESDVTEWLDGLNF